MVSLVTMALGKLFGMGETWVEAKQERETAKVKNTIAREKSKTDASITAPLSGTNILYMVLQYLN